VPLIRETWLDWKLSSHRMLSLTRMAAALCASRVRLLVGSASRSSLLPSLHISGKV
jgi:hypothetical protein